MFLKSRQVRFHQVILPCLAKRSSVWLTARSSRTSSDFHPPVQGPSFRERWLWSRSDQLRGTTSRMTILRQFIIAPSLARLIQKERGGERVLEGYFPDQPQRRTFVRIEETGSGLILEAGIGGALEERADLPLGHARALLAVSHGQVEYVRTRLAIGSHEIHVLHVIRPGLLDLATVARAPGKGQDLAPLTWFGPEVSEEPAYQ